MGSIITKSNIAGSSMAATTIIIIMRPCMSVHSKRMGERGGRPQHNNNNRKRRRPLTLLISARPLHQLLLEHRLPHHLLDLRLPSIAGSLRGSHPDQYEGRDFKGCRQTDKFPQTGLDWLRGKGKSVGRFGWGGGRLISGRADRMENGEIVRLPCVLALGPPSFSSPRRAVTLLLYIWMYSSPRCFPPSLLISMLPVIQRPRSRSYADLPILTGKWCDFCCL